ncbi:MAG: hypothetical protein MI919_04455 [Holophagales bacterium]|nr:hypothetical protein [Holophagales bacterium]
MTVLERVQQLRGLGRVLDARHLLEQELERNPNDMELARWYWEICAELMDPQPAVRPMLRAILFELRRGHGELGVFYWFELVERLGTIPPLDPDLRSRLAESMLEGGQAESAAELLEKMDGPVPPGTLLPVCVRLATAAAKSGAVNAREVVESVLARPGLPDDTRQQLTGLLEEAERQGLRADGEASDPNAPIEVSPASPAVRQMGVIAAIPVAIDGDGITLHMGDQGRKRMALSQVQAVATARIDSPTDEPYVVIDLVIDSLWSDKEVLRTVRMLSRDFDPRQLIPYAEDSQTALVTLIDNLIAVSEAQPLPDVESARGRPFHAFASIRGYEAQVLGVTA